VSRGNKRISRNKVFSIYKRVPILKSKNYKNKKENKENKCIFYRVVVMKRNFVSVRSDAQRVRPTVKMKVE